MHPTCLDLEDLILSGGAATGFCTTFGEYRRDRGPNGPIQSCSSEMQSRNNGPQAYDNKINTHDVAQQTGINDNKDSKNKGYNTPYGAS
jgi:hypothetical protein